MERLISYLVVEGPHDVEFVGRFLKISTLNRVKRLEDLDPRFLRLVPKDFPHQGDLLKRVPVPTFFQNIEHSIAVHSASGIDNLITTALDNLKMIEADVHSLGFILDRDDTESVDIRFARLKEAFEECAAGPKLPSHTGEVSTGTPRTGVFILPDNHSAGTLENLLLPAGEVVYSELSTAARTFVETVDVSKLVSKDRQDFEKPCGKAKATVSAIGSILRPGKAIQVSLQDNQWITEKTIEALPALKCFSDFLAALFGFSTTSETQGSNQPTLIP